ncbi:hypothetical protein [Salipiger sp.]|uniref:hypothetical protein n=1 Tax=Salipiger sp. TaxID=2078585 RepID=UPI003A96A7BA
MKYFDRMTNKELCTRILRGLDVLHDQVQRNDAELAATDLNTVLQALSALRRHGPLSEAAAKEIGCIEDLLDLAITQETLGFRQILAMRDLLVARIDAALMMKGTEAA